MTVLIFTSLQVTETYTRFSKVIKIRRIPRLPGENSVTITPELNLSLVCLEVVEISIRGSLYSHLDLVTESQTLGVKRSVEKANER